MWCSFTEEAKENKIGISENYYTQVHYTECRCVGGWVRGGGHGGGGSGRVKNSSSWNLPTYIGFMVQLVNNIAQLAV